MTSPHLQAADRRSWTEMIMGLPISIHRRRQPVDHDAFAHRAFNHLRTADQMFSPFLVASELSRLRSGAIRSGDLSPKFQQMLRMAEMFRLLTDGAFDVNAGPTLDPCGLVKGWAAQEASGYLPSDAYLNAGGDVVVRTGTAPWRIGIEHPHRPHSLLAVLQIATGAVATSGSAHRGAHIIVPETGLPASGVTQATVVGADLTEADVWATALIARGTRIFHRTDPILDRLTSRGYDALVVTDDARLVGTQRFHDPNSTHVAARSIQPWPH